MLSPQEAFNSANMYSEILSSTGSVHPSRGLGTGEYFPGKVAAVEAWRQGTDPGSTGGLGRDPGNQVSTGRLEGRHHRDGLSAEDKTDDRQWYARTEAVRG